MNPAAAGLCGIGVTAFYVPILRDQAKDGEISIPLTGAIRPIKVRRDEHPFLYRASLAAQIALMLLIAIGSLALIMKSFRQ